MIDTGVYCTGIFIKNGVYYQTWVRHTPKGSVGLAVSDLVPVPVHVIMDRINEKIDRL